MFWFTCLHSYLRTKTKFPAVNRKATTHISSHSVITPAVLHSCTGRLHRSTPDRPSSHTHTHAHKLTQLLEVAVSQVPATANTALFALNWFLGSKSHDTSRKLKLSWQSETESRKETTVQHNFLSSLSWYTHCCSSNKCPLNTTPSSFLAPLSFQTVIRSYQTPNSASICSTHQHLESALAVLTWGKDTHIS